jgi:flagellar hook-length control protein FliK
VGIDTNTLTLGSSMPAKTTFAARTDDSGTIASAPDPASTPAAGGNDPSSSTDAAAAAGPKTTAASAQTRNAPAARNRSTAGATRARANAANSPASQAGSAPPDAPADAGNDFGSLMASALGRSAAGAGEASIPAAATGPGASATAAPPAQPVQPTAGTSADAVAWIAQAFMAPAAGAQAVTNTAGTANPTDPSATAMGAAAAGSDAQTVRALAAQFATQKVLPAAGQSAGNAAATAVGASSGSQAPAAPANDAALSTALTAPAGNLNALADVQKLIAGLTGANPSDSDADTDADPAAPKTHAAPDSGGADAGQAAAALQGAALTRADSSVGTATLTIHAPVGSAAFADEVSAKAAGLAQSGITQAQLQLNPADLGPVQVHITMQAGQASVWFGATHADTRAALEQSLPRLREMFAGAGMPLTDSGVFREPPQQQQAPSLPASGNSRTTLAETAVAPTVTQVANIRLALLDTYA